MIEIKNRFNGSTIYTSQSADMRIALKEAIEFRAYLSGAYLSGADLSQAYLSGAVGISLERTSHLAMLRDQPGKIRAYKLVNSSGEGPCRGGIVYHVGESVSAPDADTSNDQCAAGINIATLDWCMREWQMGYRILLVEFSAADIASIPLGTNGKFRLHRCDVVGEKDLVALGLVKQPEATK